MLRRLSKWFSGGQPSQPETHRLRLRAAQWPSVIYAIGDVHGCLALLRELETQIIADARDITGEKWIVLLGDYVDRGPDSAGVLDHLLRAPPSGFKRFCLAGNHELLMLDFITAPRLDADWLRWGGAETLASYGISHQVLENGSARQLLAALQSHIPVDHQEFIKALPIALAVPGTVLVHAGMRQGIELDDQSDHDLVWLREDSSAVELAGGDRVVHGHTPYDEPLVTLRRIGIDTGVFATGRLTAVRLTEDGQYRFLSTGAGRS